ncbi:MAG: hypothetical protein ACKVKO_12900 [Acidimicrobiales bacterium]|jgi:hypothetical protein
MGDGGQICSKENIAQVNLGVIVKSVDSAVHHAVVDEYRHVVALDSDCSMRDVPSGATSDAGGDYDM